MLPNAMGRLGVQKSNGRSEIERSPPDVQRAALGLDSLCFMDLLDFATGSLMLPVGGWAIALVVSWRMGPKVLTEPVDEGGQLPQLA